MKRQIPCVLLYCTLAGFIITPGPAAHGTEIKPFTFARITDTHIGNGGVNVPQNAERIEYLNRLQPRPAFVINTGDLVDEGTARQYTVYQQTFAKLMMPRYDEPGNHDVRWAPLGKESIQDGMHIPLYRSFDANGCHFVLLDSTVTLEHWGHFDADEMRWLAADLAKTGRETPVFLFFHHWVGRDAVMVDNEDEFIRAIAPYNVKIVFCGHGHADIQWRVNGVQYVMERGLYQGSLDTADVTPQTVTLYRHRKEDAAPIRLAVIPTPRSSPGAIQARWSRGGQLEANAVDIPSFVPSAAAWQWRLDSSGKWEAMQASRDGKSASSRIDPSQWEPGHHQVQVRFVLPLPEDRKLESHDQGGFSGDVWTVSIPRDTPAGAAAGLREVWNRELGGAIQSKLLFADGRLYAACVDGTLYTSDAERGRLLWKYATHGSLYCTPCLDHGLVYIGSMDHHVYALDAATGHLRWQHEVGGPIFAGVQVGDGIAAVGSGDSIFYGLDAATGQQQWIYKTGGFIQQQAAFGDDAFYVGAWDNGFYAIEARTGQLRWKKHFGRSFFYSPSIGAPVVDSEKVYVPSDDDTLHAVNMKSGDVVWEVHSPDGAGSYGYSGPAMTADGHIFIGALGDAGSVLCLDSKTGDTVWRRDTGSVIYDSSCAVAGGVVVIGSVNGSFHALNAANGAMIGSFRLGPGHLLASPALSLDGRTAYIGSLGNHLAALHVPGPR